MLLKANEIVEKIKDSDGEFYLRTPDEETEHLSNYAKSEVDKRIGERIAEIHTQYDKDIEEAIGQKKPDGVKTYAFMKDQLSKYKEKADMLPVVEKELQEVRKSKTTDEQLKKDYDLLQGRYNKITEDITKEREQMNAEMNSFKIASMIDGEIAGYVFDDKHPKTLIDSHVKSVRQELVSTAELKDGVIIYKKGDDILESKDTYKPLTTKDRLDVLFKDIVRAGGKSGTGTGKSQQSGSGEIVPPDSALVSNDALAAWLQDELIKTKGYTRNEVRSSKEYIELYGKYRKQ